MSSRLRRQWRFQDGALTAVLVGLAIFVTWDIWVDISTIALGDEENSYILLAPVIAAWLFWMRRERLQFTGPQWTMTGPLVVVLGWATSIIGYRYGIEIAWHFGALSIVCGAALTILGWRFALAFLPAAFALLFLLPTPGVIRERIALPLQEISASATHAILELFGVPVILDGNVLRINNQDVAVAEACNGMRMVSALLLVTYAFVFSIPMRQSVRAVFLILSPLIALLVNIIRLSPTVLFYGYTSTGTAETFHDLSGWAMLGVALLILWLFQALLEWLEVPIAPFRTGHPEYAR